MRQVEQVGISASRLTHDDSSLLSSGSGVDCQVCGWRGHTGTNEEARDEEARTHFQVPPCLRLHNFICCDTTSQLNRLLASPRAMTGDRNVSRTHCHQLGGY